MGFLTKVWTGEPQGRAQGTRVGNRRGVAKSGPEEMRGRPSGNPVAEGEPCRFGYLERSQPRGVSRGGHRKDVFTFCQSFPLGNPKWELRAAAGTRSEDAEKPMEGTSAFPARK